MELYSLLTIQELKQRLKNHKFWGISKMKRSELELKLFELDTFTDISKRYSLDSLRTKQIKYDASSIDKSKIRKMRCISNNLKDIYNNDILEVISESDINTGDIEELLYIDSMPSNYNENTTEAVMKLKDGRYLYVEKITISGESELEEDYHESDVSRIEIGTYNEIMKHIFDYKYFYKNTEPIEDIAVPRITTERFSDNIDNDVVLALMSLLSSKNNDNPLYTNLPSVTPDNLQDAEVFYWCHFGYKDTPSNLDNYILYKTYKGNFTLLKFKFLVTKGNLPSIYNLNTYIFDTYEKVIQCGLNKREYELYLSETKFNLLNYNDYETIHQIAKNPELI